MKRRFITVEDAAARLGTSPAALRYHLRKGNLPGRKIGRVWRVDWDEIRKEARDDATGA